MKASCLGHPKQARHSVDICAVVWILAAVALCCLLLGACDTPHAFSGGEVEADAPYLLSTPEDLAELYGYKVWR
jgi:hypothetical protein